MEMIFIISAVIIVVGVIVAAAATFSAPNDRARSVWVDAVFYGMIGIFLTTTLVWGSTITFAVALLASLTGLLSTMAVARILTRGER